MIQKIEESLHNIGINRKIPIRIAFTDSNNDPIVISLWYIYMNGKIFCAAQKTSKVVSYLNGNPICGFEIAADLPPYKGIRGKGIARILEDKGVKVLSILIDKYLGRKESKLSKFLQNNSKTEVAIEITPKRIFSYDYSQRMKDA